MEKEIFIKECYDSLNFPFQYSKIKKIGIIPICIYNSPDSTKNGLPCIILDNKEEKFKFIVENIEEGEDVFGSLYDLFLKIFNIKIDYRSIKKCLLNVIFQEHTILFICHITGISRKTENIEYIIFEEIQINSQKICKSVRQSFYRILHLYNKINHNNYIST